MSFTTQEYQPLISVIIPCYNHGKYLAEAIESVQAQNYANKEIIVVDDGSKDNTKEITTSFSDVVYMFQSNQGLSAARNTGIRRSNGEFLVFLDADDWLLPDALFINIALFKMHEKAAFISGGFKLMYLAENKVWDVKKEVSKNHYQRLLQENYIGMHAAVMFPNWIFKLYKYDETLHACEDYDLYLRIARNYSVFHHTELIAAYRIHNNNMSANYSLMLTTALLVLNKQMRSVIPAADKKLILKGRRNFKEYYTIKIYEKLINYFNMGKKITFTELFTLWRYNKSLYLLYLKETKTGNTKLIFLFQQAVRDKLKL
jgi:glycosyltransferase involved in cell wall biosynthesis